MFQKIDFLSSGIQKARELYDKNHPDTYLPVSWNEQKKKAMKGRFESICGRMWMEDDGTNDAFKRHIQIPGQTITTSAEVTPHGALVRESS